MKKKSFSKKLSLSKEIIVNLSRQEKAKIYGGVNTTSPGDGATCINSCEADCTDDGTDTKWSVGFCTTVFFCGTI